MGSFAYQRRSSAWEFALGFVKGFCSRFWAVLVWTVKLELALLGILVGLSSLLGGFYLLTASDVDLAPMGVPLGPVRFVSLVFLALGFNGVKYCGDFIRAWWRTAVRNLPTKAEIAAQREADLACIGPLRKSLADANAALQSKRAQLALAMGERDAARAGVRAVEEDLNEAEASLAECERILTHPAMRKAGMQIWHPDRVRDEKQKLSHTETFKVVQKVFNRLLGS